MNVNGHFAKNLETEGLTSDRWLKPSTRRKVERTVTMKTEGTGFGSWQGMQESFWNRENLNSNPCSTDDSGQIT